MSSEIYIFSIINYIFSTREIVIGGSLGLAGQPSLAYLVSFRTKHTLLSNEVYGISDDDIQDCTLAFTWHVHTSAPTTHTLKKMKLKWHTYPSLEQDSWQTCHLKYKLSYHDPYTNLTFTKKLCHDVSTPKSHFLKY